MKSNSVRNDRRQTARAGKVRRSIEEISAARWLSYAEAELVYPVSARHLRTEVAAGRIRVGRLGVRRVLLDRESIDAWLSRTEAT